MNIRDYTEDKHLKCDDYPFGGGAGMVMMAQPVGSAIEAVDPDHTARRIYLSPKGTAICNQLKQQGGRVGSELLRVLSEPEKEDLLHLLEKISSGTINQR